MIQEQVTRFRCEHCGWSVDRVTGSAHISQFEPCPACGDGKREPKSYSRTINDEGPYGYSRGPEWSM